jgi:hypothetical protein
MEETEEEESGRQIERRCLTGTKFGGQWEAKSAL